MRDVSLQEVKLTFVRGNVYVRSNPQLCKCKS